MPNSRAPYVLIKKPIMSERSKLNKKKTDSARDKSTGKCSCFKTSLYYYFCHTGSKRSSKTVATKTKYTLIPGLAKGQRCTTKPKDFSSFMLLKQMIGYRKVK